MSNTSYLYSKSTSFIRKIFLVAHISLLISAHLRAEVVVVLLLWRYRPAHNFFWPDSWTWGPSLVSLGAKLKILCGSVVIYGFICSLIYCRPFYCDSIHTAHLKNWFPMVYLALMSRGDRNTVLTLLLSSSGSYFHWYHTLLPSSKG